MRLYSEYKTLAHATLMALLGNKDSMRRQAAVLELQGRGTAEVLCDCLNLCRNADPVLREMAALVLGQLSLPDADSERRVVDCLCGLAVNDPRAYVRAGAVCALGHRLGTRLRLEVDALAVLPAIEAASRDRSSTARSHASFALGSINHADAVPPLLRLLTDRDKDVRDWAAFAVRCPQWIEPALPNAYDTPEIRDALLPLTEDPNEEVRFEAINALAALRDSRVLPALRKALGDEHELFHDFVTAAVELGDRALIPDLEAALARWDDDDGVIKEALANLSAQAK